MKLFAVILGIALIIGYIFVQSGAWEVAHTMGDKEGVDIDKRRHNINWDKFFAYIKNIPRKIMHLGKKPDAGEVSK